MLYTVEVRLIGADLIGSMTEMRTWFDHRRIEPNAFRHSSGGAGVTFRVEFKFENEAIAFAGAFSGRLIGMPRPDGGAPALWPSGRAEAAELTTATTQKEHSKRGRA